MNISEESLFVDPICESYKDTLVGTINGGNLRGVPNPLEHHNDKTDTDGPRPVMDLALLEDTDSSGFLSGIEGNPPYLWAQTAKNDDEISVAILEEAVQDAIRTGKKLMQEIQSEAKESNALSLSWFGEWQRDFKKVCREQDKFCVKVGVSGGTGVGKTALINALLGYDGLLPSSAEEAATGTVCMIHRNTNDKPARRFHATVVFKTRNEVKKWLDAFFNDQKDIDVEFEDTESDNHECELEETCLSDTTGSDCDADDDDSGGKEGVDISDYLGPIQAIWGLEENDLLGMDSEAVLDKCPVVKSLLSNGKVTIASHDMSEFSEKIKPYLDCTSLQSSSADIEGGQTKVWPLVHHVDLYVESPILENGVVLEDLPGVADATDMRGKVAEDHFNELDVTIMVTAIERAADSKVTSELISNNQALRLQLDGKLNNQKFCIATSKTDMLDWESYLIKELRSARSACIDKEYEKYKTVKNDLKDTKSRLEQAKKDQKDVDEDLHIMATRYNDQRSMRQALAEFTQAKAVVDDLRDVQEFLCSSARNERTKNRIQKLVYQSKSAFKRNTAHGNVDGLIDDAISVFPVSSTAFWKLHDIDGQPATGFPKINYTGVPALQAWIRNASVPARKAHASRLLSKLNSLLNVLLTWTDDTIIGVGSVRRPDVVLRGTLDPFKDTLKQNLTVCGENLISKVKQFNPLTVAHEGGKRLRPKCRKDVLDQVKRWCMAEPHKPRSMAKIHWSTHAAIVKRGGVRYKSKGRLRVEYAWMDNMSDRVLIEVVEKWNDAFHKRLPEEARGIPRLIEKTWNMSLHKVCMVLPKLLPNDLEYLAGRLSAIQQIRETVSKDIEQAMHTMAKRASGVHPRVRLTFANGWRRIFARASPISGKKIVKRRQNLFVKHARVRTTPLITKALQDMEGAINLSIESFENRLGEIWKEGLERIDQQIKTLLENVTMADEVNGHVLAIDSGERDIDRMLKKKAAPYITIWREDWISPGTIARMQEETASTDIPQEYIPEPDNVGLDVESDSESELTCEPAPKSQRTTKSRRRQMEMREAGVSKAPRKRKTPAKPKLELEEEEET